MPSTISETPVCDGISYVTLTSQPLPGGELASETSETSQPFPGDRNSNGIQEGAFKAVRSL
jgi:hypothetical protein